MKRKNIKKKIIKMPIKIVQLVDDEYWLDYEVIGSMLDAMFLSTKNIEEMISEEGKTYVGAFTTNCHSYSVSLHVFKKYLEVRIVLNDGVDNEK